MDDDKITTITEHTLTNVLCEPMQQSVSVGTSEGRVEIPVVFAKRFAELLLEDVKKKNEVNKC
jgi:hypothetical protein